MNRTVISQSDIDKRMALLAATQGGAAPSSVVEVPDKYLDRLLKYVPPDVLTAYVALEGAIAAAHGSQILGWIVFGVLLVGTPLLSLASRRRTEEPSASDLNVGIRGVGVCLSRATLRFARALIYLRNGSIGSLHLLSSTCDCVDQAGNRARDSKQQPCAAAAVL